MNRLMFLCSLLLSAVGCANQAQQNPDLELRCDGAIARDIVVRFTPIPQGVEQYGDLPMKTFLVANTGPNKIIVEHVRVMPPFRLVEGAKKVIDPGGSTSFTVVLDTTKPGLWTSYVIVDTANIGKDKDKIMQDSVELMGFIRRNPTLASGSRSRSPARPYVRVYTVEPFPPEVVKGRVHR